VDVLGKLEHGPPSSGTPERAIWAAEHGERPTHVASYSHPVHGMTTTPIHGAANIADAEAIARKRAPAGAVLQSVSPWS
jgi:hypothetical protein